MCMNVREVLDYVVVYVGEYVYECERGSRLWLVYVNEYVNECDIGSRLCGDVCGCV